MRRLSAALIAVAVLAAAPQAHAGMTSLGTDFGLTIHHPSGGGDNTTIFGLPGSSLAFQPGLRIGCQVGGETHEVYVDGGFMSLSSGGDSERFSIVSLNYQYNFEVAGNTRPYITAGLGLFNEHFSSGGMSDGATSGVGGGGLGIRHWVADHHGSLRLEARYDRVGWSKHGEIDKAGLFSVKAGFDLWLK